MDKVLISSNSKFEKLYGHSRAIACDPFVFVAGTVGFDYEADTISDDPAEQTHQTFRNIENALQQAGASFSDVVQIITYYTSHDDWEAIGSVLQQWLGDVRPGNTGVRVELIDPRMKIEISAIAVKQAR